MSVRMRSTVLAFLVLGTFCRVFSSVSLVDMDPETITLFHKIANHSYHVCHHATGGTMQSSNDEIGDITWEVTPFRDSNKRAVGVFFSSEASPFIVATFHGSYFFSDWWQNAKFITDPADTICASAPGLSGKVHRGFSQIVKGIYPNFETTFTALFPDLSGKQVIFTGHSLGGALSRIMASVLAHSRNNFESNQVKVLTFSSPRVGDQAFSMAMEEKVGRENIIDFRHKADFLIGLDDWVLSNSFSRSDVGVRIEVGFFEKIQHSAMEIWRSPLDDTLRGGFNPFSILNPFNLVSNVVGPKLHTFDDVIVTKVYRHFKEKLLSGLSVDEASRISSGNPQRNPLLRWFRK